jgi:hypothetical protein
MRLIKSSQKVRSKALNQIIFWSFWFTLITLPFSFSTPQTVVDQLSITFHLPLTIFNIGIANILFSMAILMGLKMWAQKRGYRLRPWSDRTMGLFLYWLSGKLPCRIISEDSSPYLERYYLFSLFGARFYIHRFVASDPDRGFHDHPWCWARSIVLLGHYTEQTPNGEFLIDSSNLLDGYDFHRVVLDVDTNGKPLECWTLFFHDDKYSKKWGFLRPSQSSPGLMCWYPWNYDRDDASKDGSASSGLWWLDAPLGKRCADRQTRNQYL